MSKKEIIHLGHQAPPQSHEPATIDLRVREQLLFDCLTELTVTIETPQARRARERREARDSQHKHRVEFVKLVVACIILVGFLAASICLLAFKPNATQNAKLLMLAGTIVSGSAVYFFGSKTDKSG